MMKLMILVGDTWHDLAILQGDDDVIVMNYNCDMWQGCLGGVGWGGLLIGIQGSIIGCHMMLMWWAI